MRTQGKGEAPEEGRVPPPLDRPRLELVARRAARALPGRGLARRRAHVEWRSVRLWRRERLVGSGREGRHRCTAESGHGRLARARARPRRRRRRALAVRLRVRLSHRHCRARLAIKVGPGACCGILRRPRRYVQRNMPRMYLVFTCSCLQ